MAWLCCDSDQWNKSVVSTAWDRTPKQHQKLLERENVLSIVYFSILVGCDATVNVSEQNGLRGKIQAALPWIHWS